jgi:hypothetical protein
MMSTCGGGPPKIARGGIAMVKDATGRDGLSAGGLAKELGVSAAEVKNAPAKLAVAEADFVKAGCGYYFVDRLPAIKAALT